MRITAESVLRKPRVQPWSVRKKQKEQDKPYRPVRSSRRIPPSHTRSRDTITFSAPILDKLFNRMENSPAHPNEVDETRGSAPRSPVPRSNRSTPTASDPDHDLASVDPEGYSRSSITFVAGEEPLLHNTPYRDRPEDRALQVIDEEVQYIESLDSAIRQWFPAARFGACAQSRVRQGLYHVKLEDLRHVIMDRIDKVYCAERARKPLNKVLDIVRLVLDECDKGDDGNDLSITIKGTVFWSKSFLLPLGPEFDAQDESHQNFTDPLLEWMFAEAGTWFLHGPECRSPEFLPQYFESCRTRSELAHELQQHAIDQRERVIAFLQSQ
ncbi:uncharacterized protein PV09_06092 [Verruconis gallopava]|uniref:Uncharacterized protein n=1 Tax=Verruconis gallopava TaxID=253628 RepID=A0A0D2AU44_9PEZI|nr:uncharacterized protein PV09_06092 [Verruconis gallopava]KIW02654.1 hypothetical protein PV09_06092 [Verruconis gallopava]